jgi:hypothetical protein
VSRVKKAFPENQQKSPQVSFATAVIATTLATVTCYPLDTIRRQMQVTGCQYTSVFDAFPGKLSDLFVPFSYISFEIRDLATIYSVLRISALVIALHTPLDSIYLNPHANGKGADI